MLDWPPGVRILPDTFTGRPVSYRGAARVFAELELITVRTGPARVGCRSRQRWRLLLVEDEVLRCMGESNGVAVRDIDDGVETCPLPGGEDE